jgi:two-component system chemotaxis sensor kinase CheA
MIPRHPGAIAWFAFDGSPECCGATVVLLQPNRKTAAAGPAARATAPAAQTEAATIRVAISKVDQLINLVGELVITQAMLAQNSRALDPAVYQQMLVGLADLDRNTRDLQESVMSIRMIPMSIVFSRFPRMLRDLAGKLGKKVDFITQGEATELDKGLVEKITDPLTHLVRNSCDHGIEMPADRLAAGKPETGTITLSAAHQGGSIVIEVRDDGRGMSREKILSKARERGLSVSDQMPDSEVWQLIFAPGFSTAEVVTDVSGRGVGMDVVKRNITALNGTVEIDSAEGFGMKVSVRLPDTGHYGWHVCGYRQRGLSASTVVRYRVVPGGRKRCEHSRSGRATREGEGRIYARHRDGKAVSGTTIQRRKMQQHHGGHRG